MPPSLLATIYVMHHYPSIAAPMGRLMVLDTMTKRVIGME